MSRTAAVLAVAAAYCAGFAFLFRGVHELCLGGAELSAIGAGVGNALLGLSIWAALGLCLRRRAVVR